MLGLGGVPSLVQLAGLLCLPESPRWLLDRGDAKRARAVLLKLRRTLALALTLTLGPDPGTNPNPDPNRCCSSCAPARCSTR